MSRQAFFAYERDFAERWCPVIYYDEVPTLKPYEKRQEIVTRSIVYEVSDYINEDGEVGKSFNELQSLYPIGDPNGKS